MAVAGMAAFARGTDVEGTQPIEGGIVLGDGVFEEELTVFEGVHHAGVFDSGSRVFVGGGGLVEGGAETAAGIGLFVYGVGDYGLFLIAIARGQAKSGKSGQHRNKKFFVHVE